MVTHLDSSYMHRKGISHFDMRIINLNPTTNKIVWDIDYLEDPEKVQIKGFNLYYSRSKSDSLVMINSELLTDLYVRHTLNNYDKFKRGYYQIEIVFANGDAMRMRTFDIFNKHDKYFNVLRQRETWRLMSDIIPDSVPVAIFQKRRVGNLCPRCGISKSMGSAQAKCKVCLGTGFEGGYYKPHLGFVTYENIFSQNEVHTGIEQRQEMHIPARTTSTFAFFKVNDYVRELDPPNRLFCVTALTVPEKQGSPVSYILSLQQEDSFHPLYSYLLPFNDNFVKDQGVYYRTVDNDYDRLQYKFQKSLTEVSQRDNEKSS